MKITPTLRHACFTTVCEVCVNQKNSLSSHNMNAMFKWHVEMHFIMLGNPKCYTLPRCTVFIRKVHPPWRSTPPLECLNLKTPLQNPCPPPPGGIQNNHLNWQFVQTYRAVINWQSTQISVCGSLYKFTCFTVKYSNERVFVSVLMRPGGHLITMCWIWVQRWLSWVQLSTVYSSQLNNADLGLLFSSKTDVYFC